MKTKLSCTVIAIFVLLSPFANGNKRPNRITIGQLGYVDSAATIYYYTTGIVRKMVNGDKQEAMTMFAEAINLDSMFAPAYFQAALLLVDEDVPIALEFSEKANKIDTTNVWYKAQYGRLLIMSNQFDKAKDVYTKLIEIDSSNPDNYRLLAALYEEMELPFTAISVLDSAEYKLGRDQELSSYKRDLLVKVKLYDVAIRETNNLIAEFPHKSDNYLYLGKIYTLTNKDSLARASFIKAVELAPDDVSVLSELNDYYRTKGDIVNFLSTAKTLFRSQDISVESKVEFYQDITNDRNFYRENFFQISDLALSLIVDYPDNYRASDLYATTLVASGKIEDALTLYKSFLATNPPMECYNSILDIESYLKRPDSVVLYSARALERFPNSVDIYLRQSSSMSYLKDYDRAIKSLKTGLKYAPTDSVRSVVYGMIGDIYYTQSKTRESYANYKTALKCWPNNVLVLNNYAYYLSEQDRDLEKALAMSSRVSTLAPGVATYLDTHAWILYKLGSYDEAKKLMLQAVSLDREGSSVLFQHYGDILYKLNDYFMASFYWNKALEKGADPNEIEQRLKLVEGK